MEMEKIFSAQFTLEKFIKKFNWDMYHTLLVFVAVFIFITMSVLEPYTFPTLDNLISMAFQISELGIFSISMTLALIIGGIDLSITAIANLSAIFAGLLLKSLISVGANETQIWLGFLLAVLIALATGVLCGAINGLLIGWIGVPAILATLSTATLYTGIAMGITKGSAISGFPSSILIVGNGEIFHIPIPFLIFVVILIFVSVLLNHTSFGFKMYMLGTNPIAAYFSGIDNKILIFKTHTLIGMLSSIAGIIILTHTNAAYADYGTSYILLSLLVAVLGGISVTGGFGKLSGVVLALIILQFLSTGFNMVFLEFTGSNFFRDFAWGTLLLLVIVINRYNKFLNNLGSRIKTLYFKKKSDLPAN
ncbi:ABC transporter permease [Caldanaerobacter subterraneus]|uniref:Ribose/xylose/arabinose/galactoside ABC-type transporter permease n=1 Tax=Caldanaerobacter subterraneus subsp. pacificus DSM 12653 TaxID=391606 RepID=A0A0F5PQ71_9THEO|nr:ABC transporter permease [Caldanaerobacter subterraneus]KKC30740.1 ribose/xylose/arabinose/galactoside ABC-type transporter permease [Caldanaerobacter subterraneus subsp. pacificus DSM 12653]